MMLSSRVTSLFTLAVLALALVGGILVGVRLGERASEPGTQTMSVPRPSNAAPRDVALRSKAGFTGFEPGALGGVVTRAGVASAFEEGRFSVQTETASIDVRIAGDPVRLYRIAPAEGALAPGDLVVVRLDEDGETEAVLRLPPDLREGDSRR